MAMDDPVAVVKQIHGSRAVVEAESAVCPRCRAGQGCGAGIFTGRGRTGSLSVTVAEALSLAPGDRVALRIARGGLLRGVSLLYGLPLAGLVAGALFALLAGAGDTWAVAWSAGGLLAGFLAGARIARREPCLSELRPVACRRLPGATARDAGQ